MLKVSVPAALSKQSFTLWLLSLSPLTRQRLDCQLRWPALTTRGAVKTQSEGQNIHWMKIKGKDTNKTKRGQKWAQSSKTYTIKENAPIRRFIQDTHIVNRSSKMTSVFRRISAFHTRTFLDSTRWHPTTNNHISTHSHIFRVKWKISSKIWTIPTWRNIPTEHHKIIQNQNHEFGRTTWVTPLDTTRERHVQTG